MRKIYFFLYTISKRRSTAFQPCIALGGLNWAKMGQQNFSKKSALKTAFWGDTILDKLTSNEPCATFPLKSLLHHSGRMLVLLYYILLARGRCTAGFSLLFIVFHSFSLLFVVFHRLSSLFITCPIRKCGNGSCVKIVRKSVRKM